MKIDRAAGPPEAVDAQVLALAVVDPATELPPAGRRLDLRLDGRLSRLVAAGDLRGDWNAVCVVHLSGELTAERFVAAGVGSRDTIDSDSLRDAAAAVVRAEARVGGTLAWLLDESLPLPLSEQARAVVDGVVLGGYEQARWKTREPKRKQFDRLVLVGGDDAAVALAQRAERVAQWTNRARDLANAPPNELTPERLAARAAEIADGAEHLAVEALGPGEIEALGMGAFAAVAQGSHRPPRLIVMRYEPLEPAREDVVLGLVGKAITFDAGGISIKPADYMEDMKGDMSGGAAVIEAVGAIADLGVPLQTLAVVAATENMVGGGSYRPGDILTAMNGKTIEVTNTDAEGRLVLADALCYAREEGATHLLDLATLTGAMERALGDFYAGVFAKDPEWRDLVVAAGEATGDHAWPWPMHRRYRRYIESSFADMKNTSIRRQGIPVYAAEFLEEFVGEGPWAHADIAGAAFLTWSRGDYLSQQGGTGWGVRLIVELASRLSEPVG